MSYLSTLLNQYDWYTDWVRFGIQYSVIALVMILNFLGAESVGDASTVLAQIAMVNEMEKKKKKKENFSFPD